MSDNLVLEMLRHIRNQNDDIKADIQEIKERLGFLEAQYASLSRRVDRIAGDVEVIKRRLGLVEAP